MTALEPPRLSRATLHQASAGVDRPGYDLDDVEIGVVHLGLGAFARAHQFELYERLLNAGDRRWGVCGVSLNRPDAREALVPQDGLYTLVRLGGNAPPQIVGALREVLTAPQTPDAVLSRLAALQTRVVALTVTEKGYHLDPAGELDLRDPLVAHDLAAESGWRTPVAWLAAGLRRRRAERLPPFLTLSCDNLSGNGGKLARAVSAFLRDRGERSLAEWVDGEAQFLDSMVDSITPATDEALREAVAAASGLNDAWPVQREAFSQWVVGDCAAPPLEELAAVGLTLTNDVAGYERAKLRLLNGAHSALAYLGLAAGHETVFEAISDTALRSFVEHLMRYELAPTVRPPRQLDVHAYVTTILERFDQPAIRHRLSQIAADGSVKLPIRLLEAMQEIYLLNGSAPLAAAVIVAWANYFLGLLRNGQPLMDPNSERLVTSTKSIELISGTDFILKSGLVGVNLVNSAQFMVDLLSADSGGGDS